MNSDIIIILMIFMLAAPGVGIALFAIIWVRNANSQYEKYAISHSYKFDKAMVYNTSYREYTSHAVSVGINGENHPCVDKYADFNEYPFGRGLERIVAYVIEGEYKQTPFRTFVYQFEGNLLDSSKGGTFSIYMIRTKLPPRSLPKDTYYENGVIWRCEKGYYKVKTIEPVLDDLIGLTTMSK